MDSCKLIDIAKKFNVSAMSVSNALNGRKGISAAKAEAIRKYADEIGYRPAFMARSLVTNRTDIVGVCMRANLGDPWAGTLIHKLQDELLSHHLHVHLILTDNNPEIEVWALNFFNELRVDGVIVGPLDMPQYEKREKLFKNLKHVVCFGSTAPLPCSHVKYDEYAGAWKAVDYLVKRKITRIGHIGIRLKTPLNIAQDIYSRQAGFCDAVKAHGLPLKPEWILSAASEAPGEIEQQLDNFLSSGLERPEAWFFQSDTWAIRCYKVFQKHGLEIPRDVSVIGFDNNPIGELVSPELTTVGFDNNAYAKQLTKFLLDGRPETSATPQSYVLQPEIIERASVRKK